MANEVGELVVKIAADISDIKAKMLDVQKSTDAVKNSLEKNLHPAIRNVTDQFKLLANPVYAASAAFVAVAGGVVASVKAYADYGEQLNKMSMQTGISVESLSRLKYAAEQEEASLESLAAGMKLLQKNMSAIGDTSSTYDRLMQIADAVKAAESPVKKAEIAFVAFGRAGYDLIPMLNQGSSGLKELGDKAEAMGIVMDSKAAKKADELNDSLNTMKNQLLGVAIQITNAVMPAINFWLPKMEAAIAFVDRLAGVETKAAQGREITIKTLQAQKDAIIEGNRAMQQQQMRVIELTSEEKKKIALIDKSIAREKEFMKAEEDAAKKSIKTNKNRNDKNQDDAEDFVKNLEKLNNRLTKNNESEAEKRAEKIATTLASMEARYRTHGTVVSMLTTFYSASQLATLQRTLDASDQARVASDLKELTDLGLMNEARALAEKIYIDKTQANASAFRKWETLANAERLQNFSSTMNNIATLSESKHKSIAAIGKAAAIASSTVDTYRAATTALASAPYPFNFVLMGLTIAAGLANVAKIAGVKMAQGGVVKPTEGGTQATIGEAGQAEAVIPLGDNSAKEMIRDAIAPEASNRLEVNVYVNGTLIEGDVNKWRQITRSYIVPELQRFTDISPNNGMLTRKRARS